MTVPLINDKNESRLWYGTISIGTPPVDFTGMTLSSDSRSTSNPVSYTVGFDTGSSDLFVPSTSCENLFCFEHKKYDPSASSTSHDLGMRFNLSYLDASNVTGKQYTDVVTIAGLVVRGMVSFLFSYKSLTRLTIGEESDARRRRRVL